MHRSIAIAFALTLSCVASTASAEQCEDKLQQDKSQQNSADEAQVRGDLKAGSQCATPGDKEESAKKNEDRAAKLKGEGKVEDHTTTGKSTYQGIEANRVAASLPKRRLMALVKHRNSRRYHAPSETSKIRLGPACPIGVDQRTSAHAIAMSALRQ